MQVDPSNYDQVFKTRVRVIDDRPSSALSSYPELEIPSTLIKLDPKELLYLEQYRIDVEHLDKINSRIDHLHAEISSIKQILNQIIEFQQQEYLPGVIKIQVSAINRVLVSRMLG
jgi:hypothetical protein